MACGAITLMSLSNKHRAKFVGHWVLSDDSNDSKFRSFDFYDNGTYSSGNIDYRGTYTPSGKNIRLEGFQVDDINALYEVKGNTLTLEYEGRSETYLREDR